MLAWLALLLGALAAPERASQEEVAQCFGPFFGFEAGTDRFNEGTARGFDGIVEHMNSPLWRHGWFVLHSEVRDPDDRAAIALVRRREARILRELTRRGIGRDRIRLAPVETGARHGEDEIYVMSTVPRHVWEQIVPPDVIC